MKRCNICGREYPDSLSFCTNCGSKLSDGITVTTEPHKGSPTEESKSVKTPKPKSKSGKIIKRVLIAVVAVIVVLFLWGSHLMNSTTYMTFNSQGELYAKSGGTSSVNIDYDGYVWEVNYKPSWVSIDEYDDSFTIHCQPNTTGQDREDHITIKSGKIVQTLPIGQYGQTQFIKLSESSLKSDIDGGSIHIDIETDGSGPEISYPKFCRIEDHTEYGFTLIISSNSEYSRSGTLYVKEDNVSASIYISQEGKCQDCNGHGTKTCPSCGGMGSTGFGYYSINCFTCGGTGSIRCYSCSGSGIR